MLGFLHSPGNKQAQKHSEEVRIQRRPETNRGSPGAFAQSQSGEAVMSAMTAQPGSLLQVTSVITLLLCSAASGLRCSGLSCASDSTMKRCIGLIYLGFIHSLITCARCAVLLSKGCHKHGLDLFQLSVILLPKWPCLPLFHSPVKQWQLKFSIVFDF